MFDSLIFQFIIRLAGAGVVSYFFGSVNFAIIITYLFTRKDVRKAGSGNAGMTNVMRTVGIFPAFLTLVGDFGKSVAAILFSRWLFESVSMQNAAQIGMYVGGLFVLLGHIFPVFFRFSGGKGVLTCAGVFLVLDWKLCLVCVGVFIIVALISGYVSLGSIAALCTAPPLTFIVGFTLRSQILSTPAVLWESFFILIIVGISVYMHRENIGRLIKGTENGFRKKRKNKTAENRGDG